MAGLDPARFREERPRYQRFLVPDRRRAWVGTREELPDVELHVEAGSFEGRPCLFDVSTLAAIGFLGEDPEPRPISIGDRVLWALEPLLMLALILGAAWLARRHVKQGRADQRGAMRFAVLLGGGIMLSIALASHVLFSPGGIDEIWPLLSAAFFLGAIIWALYVAVEPIGRRVWPSMFVSLSRMLSRPRIEARDPLLGRSVLIGLAAGVLLFVLRGPGRWALVTALQGTPPDPLSYDLSVLLGQRMAISGLLAAFIVGVRAFLLVTLLVFLRLLLKRSWLAVAIAAVVWPLLWGVTSPEMYALDAVYAVVALAVLLRAGVLALLVATVVVHLGRLASAPDWSAWYGQAAALAATAVAILGAYGVWAAVKRGRGDDPAGP
jgi:hypothetical protein